MQYRWIGWIALLGGTVALSLGLKLWVAQAQPPLEAAAEAQTEVRPAPTETNDVTEATAVDDQLTQANLAFGFDLFEQLRQASPDSNVLVSPTSVGMALAMAYNGAAAETQTAMAAVLGLQGMDLDQVNQANQALACYLRGLDPEVDLTIANSLWINQDLPVYEAFIQRVQGAYGAEVANLNFSDPAAKDQINAWVKAETRDRIPTIVDDISPDQLMFLINAVYFKGDWAEAFDPELTRDRPFTLTDGTEIQHPRMVQGGNYHYLETDQFQAISLPYGNGSLSFEVILPAEDMALDDFYAQLTPETWQSWMNQMRPQDGEIQLPRFQFAYEADLVPALESLGMGIAFEAGRADFSSLTELESFINQVRHKTFIDVTEEGTEAAAATSIGIMPTSLPAPEEQPFRMEVDRPFFAAIRDVNTGTLLFMGAIADPR